MDAVIVLLILLFVLLAIGVPVGFAIGGATMISMFFFSDLNMVVNAQYCYSGIFSFTVMAIPYFMLAGTIMSTGGIARRIVDFASALIDFVTGALGCVSMLACMFFGALTGSGMATTSAIGGMMIPEMKRKGYDSSYAATLVCFGGIVGPIIPPSLSFVLYGASTKTSVPDLFKAGIIPGLAMGVALMIVCYIMAKKYGFKGETKKFSFKAVVKSFVDAIWALLSPVIILGGIYSGKFTPTEAAVISVVYSYIVGRFVYKELDNKGVYKALRDTIVINGSTTFMVGLSSAFAAYLSLTGIPRTLAAALIGVTDNKIILLILINIFLLVIGCLVDNIPATIILAPILLPVVEALGMSPVTFGIMLTMNLAIGFCTPPYGIDLFVASAISGVSIGKMMKFMLWFIFSLLVVLMLVTYWPAFTMFALA